jgi:hypothetical protein
MMLGSRYLANRTLTHVWVHIQKIRNIEKIHLISRNKILGLVCSGPKGVYSRAKSVWYFQGVTRQAVLYALWLWAAPNKEPDGLV